MKGKNEYGNYSNCGVVTADNLLRVVEMTGDMEIAGGNWRFARVNRNGFELTSSILVLGLYIDGVKQDSHVDYEMGPWGKIIQFKDALQAKRAGEDAWDAWEWIVDYCQANPAADKTAFLAAFDAQDFATYQGYILKMIGILFEINGYGAIRDAINTQSRARLAGEDTELIREIS